MKFSDPFSSEPEKRNALAGLSILIIGFLFTSFITFYVVKKNKAEDELRFDFETHTVMRRIQNRMSQYEGALIQTRAFLNNTGPVNRDQLQKYLKDTEIFRRYPGLQGMGYAVMIRPNELKQHLKEMREKSPGYHVWPEGERDIYSSVTVLEPFDWRNQRAIGFDMFQEPIRKKAMTRALEQNKAIMSDKVILVQEEEGEKLPGFNLYLPVFKENSNPTTPLARTQNVTAFIYSPFRAKELFKAIFADLDMMVDVEIYINHRPEPKDLVYDFDGNKGQVRFGLQSYEVLEIAGKKILIHFTPLTNFNPSYSHWKSIGVLLIGLLTTYVLFLIYLFTRKQIRIAKVIAQEKERLLQKEKEHVSARDDFLSIASHELKTPLTSLKLQAQVMKRAMEKNDPSVITPEKVKNLVHQIDNQTTRLTRLVDDMLDISRIRTGRLKMIKEEVELNDLVQDVIDRLTHQFMASIGDVPVLERTSEVRGHWDRFRLEQVFVNLLTNAIRYGNKNPVRVRIEKNETYAKVFVIDRGIGIAPENISKIFNQFERAGMSANEVSGMGLGLFITLQIVKAHGGTIDVQSELDRGSTFIVSLPL